MLRIATRPTNATTEGMRCDLRLGLVERDRIIAKARAGDLQAHEAIMLEFNELCDKHVLPPHSINDYVGHPELMPLGRLNG